ncbi:MAG TPA: DNA-formamidopyrimidine glycosylase [Candidatus Parcubacteria bacterium]|nr:DNA-formamidopyrimidine glycosylase [Candidatus Parcubacteria bacterium]
MPELPEVETIVRGLKKKVLNKKIKNLWTDSPKLIKKPKSFTAFKKALKGRKIEAVRRRGKNILLEVSGGKTILIHQKLTGHLLFGKWRRKKGKWISEINGPLAEDPMNKFLHIIFWLDKGCQLALSDLRKLAKLELWDKKELERSKGFLELGPEPLSRDFSFQKFKEAIAKKKGPIKRVLMDQKVIAGIGNIYSDEILFLARIHPLTPANMLSAKQIKKLYQSIREILKIAIKYKGTTILSGAEEYRLPSGERGKYQEKRQVYRKENKPCPRCGKKIKRIKIGQRSAHFCSVCQKID